MVQQGDQRGDRRLAARRKSAARVLDTTRFHRAPAALGETRWQRISTDLSVFPYYMAVERSAALTATALRGSASRYNKGPLLPAGMGLTQSANCREAPISARTSKQAPALPRATHACIFALATLQLLRHDMSYNVSNPVPRQHGARSTTIVNDAYYPGPGGKMHSWKRNLALELAQTKR